ncbi:hypothetical protein HGRIS_011518 [Hohenbuehelia grisea]|uniref:Signal peptidase complex subunit 2 n=1 Tax=Hohenbuehelia grisea TaxID=104357 RepID=A0ABR3JWB9_9AGAR
MARQRKSAANGDPQAPSPTLSETELDRPVGPLSSTAPTERDVVKVNNANVTDLKNSCDDAVKRYLSRPDLFKQIHIHTDIRLALGWISVFVAAGTAFYGYKVDFETSKPVVWAGLVLYIVLTSIQAAYAYIVEGDIVFVGKRKTFAKRIVTERITISSRTTPSRPNKPPTYGLSVSYVRSASGGKTLLGRGKKNHAREYNAFFDETGVLHQEVFEAWVGSVVEEAMEGKSS